MKIIVLASYSTSLINFRKELLEALVNRGHQVTACAPENNFEVEQILNSMGIAYKTIAFERTGMNPLSDLNSLSRLISIFKKHEPDVLLSYTIKPVIYGSIAGRLVRTKDIFSIITGLGYTFEGNSKRRKLLRSFIKALYRKSLSYNTKVFFQNPDDLRLFQTLSIIKPGREVLINGSGVNLSKYEEADPIIFPPTFLLIGRLLIEKGVEDYIEAAKIIRKKYPQANFQLLGRIDKRNSSINQKQLNEWQKQGVIEYLGETKDVRPFIADSSVYVLPSYREGTPRSVLEAMAMGRPIITTDAPGCRETVKVGRNGFLVPVNNPTALAASMEKFIVDPSLIEHMGRQSRLYAEERYNVHSVNEVILDAMGI